MKLTKIIIKNFKTLFRSKSSALVLILGPLILISLVGLAFNNTSTFLVNVGYQAPEGNELVNSYMSQIDTSTYTVNRFDDINTCIENIKLSTIHACIDFPEDFEISNNKVNEIKFYVDQSKVNLVYSIVDTISKSFSRASSNLSVELTNDILSVVTQNKGGMLEAKAEIDKLIEANNELKEISNELQRDLNTIVIDTKEASKSTGSLNSLSEDLEDNIQDMNQLAQMLVETGLKLEDYGIPTNEENWTDTIETLEYYNEPDDENHKNEIWYLWNDTNAIRLNLMTSVTSLTGSVTDMIDDIDAAKEKQTKVKDTLKEDINPSIDENNEKANEVKDTLSGLVFLIDNIEVSDAESVVNPITTKIETVSSEKSHLSFLFPSLIILLIMFISILISSNLILMEKNSKAYFRNFTTPTNDSLFILSTYLTGIIMVLMQIVIVLSVATWAFDAPLLQNIGMVSLLILISSTLFIFIGMAIGYIFNSEETAMIGAISVSSLFLLLSDLILPLESMPRTLFEIAQYNPFVLGSETLRQVMLFSVGYQGIKSHLWIMIGFSLVILTLMVIIQQIMKFLYL